MAYFSGWIALKACPSSFSIVVNIANTGKGLSIGCSQKEKIRGLKRTQRFEVTAEYSCESANGELFETACWFEIRMHSRSAGNRGSTSLGDQRHHPGTEVLATDSVEPGGGGESQPLISPDQSTALRRPRRWMRTMTIWDPTPGNDWHRLVAHRLNS